MHRNILLLTMLTTLTVVPQAMGGIISYSLTDEGCSSGCNVLPAGTITVESSTIGTVMITVELGADYSFRGANDANHHGLVFNIAGNPAVTISNITSGATSQTWTLNQNSTYNNSPFGSFEYAIECTTCSPGMAGVTTRNLSFTLQAAGITENSFTATNNIFFAVDVVGKTAAAGVGLTGNIGALQGTPGTGVPEPGTVVTLSSGLLLAYAARRFRSRNEL